MSIKKIQKCLFPAAGYGTRFLPATKSIPKEMLPVMNKPLIHYGVEEAVQAGIDKMCIVNGRHKEAIANYFDIQYELEDKLRDTGKSYLLDSTRQIMEKSVFSYVRQKYMRGLGDAILSGKPLIGDEPFAVLLADDLCIDTRGLGVLAQMCTLFEQHQCSIIAVQRVAKKDLSNYGVIIGESIGNRLIRVTSAIEKPQDTEIINSDLAIIGRYILTPDIFASLQTLQLGAKGELQITDAIHQQAQQGKVLAYLFEGERFDCGQIDGMVRAINYVYSKNSHL